MWSIWLQQDAFAPAMAAARTQQQRDAVLAKHAQRAMEAGNDVEAGRLLGKVMANEPSFEDVALMFVDRENPDGLQVHRPCQELCSCWMLMVVLGVDGVHLP